MAGKKPMPPAKGGKAAHMKEEMAALKKGGASKKLLAEEKAEYAAEGYKNGGKVKGKKK